MASGCNPLQKGGEVFPRMYLPSMPIQGGGGSNVLGNGERAEGAGERPKSNRTKKKKREKEKEPWKDDYSQRRGERRSWNQAQTARAQGKS